MEGHLDVQAPVNHEPVALDPALAYNVQLQACPLRHSELEKPTCLRAFAPLTFNASRV